MRYGCSWPAAVVDRRRRHDSYRGIAAVSGAKLNGGKGRDLKFVGIGHEETVRSVSEITGSRQTLPPPPTPQRRNAGEEDRV